MSTGVNNGTTRVDGLGSYRRWKEQPEDERRGEPGAAGPLLPGRRRQRRGRRDRGAGERRRPPRRARGRKTRIIAFFSPAPF